MIEIESLISIIFWFLIIIVGICKIIRTKKDTSIKKVTYEEHLQKQATTEPEFINEAGHIKKMIVEEKYEDIREIGERLSLTSTDCIKRIDYLRKCVNELNGYYLDYYHKTIKKCSPEEYKLLDKYVGYVYNDKLQIDQIAHLMRRTSTDDIYILKTQIKKDIKYLISKELVDGIKYDEKEDKIIRLNLKNNSLISEKCPSCGAVNDVKEGRKAHCKYCNAIIKTHIK